MRKQIRYSPQDKINNHRIYSLYLQIGVDDGWSKKDKWENFKTLVEIAALTRTSLQGSAILDVGCGTGDMVQFLENKNIKEYVGVDIFSPAIEKAQQKYPDQKFIAEDFLRLSLKKKFDFVFCSGALTTVLETDNYEILQPWISKMWKLAKIGVAFNFLVDNKANEDTLFLYDPERVIGICKEIAPEAHIKTLTTDAGSGNSLQKMHIFLY